MSTCGDSIVASGRLPTCTRRSTPRSWSERELRRPCLRLPEIRASTLADEGVALGALRLALDEVDHRLFGTGLSAPLPPRRH
ncbi:hypothetical protein ACIQCJ_03610 [Streptomyces sp. NPDC093221]|uniref:hypothetical protein n=1 Tax=Streptomyces sp. NPDC093221 TaxID=3366032 RepID=UPI003803A9D1